MDASYKLIIDIIGWIGSAEVIIAYWMISTHRVTAKSSGYQLLNLSGAIFLIVNTYYYHSFPSMAINIVWVGIAIQALIKASTYRDSEDNQ
ncbi:MAG: hypothetical protein OCD76_24405 [Reichenbachiella sp.]